MRTSMLIASVGLAVSAGPAVAGFTDHLMGPPKVGGSQADPGTVYSSINDTSAGVFLAGNARDLNGLRLTRLVADDAATITYAAGAEVARIYFSVVNANSAPVPARVRLRFWQDSGSGTPGDTYPPAPDGIGFTFDPMTFDANSDNILYADLSPGIFPLPGTSTTLWMGMFFDDNGPANPTGITFARLNLLGPIVVGPSPDIGTSSDQVFRTAQATELLGTASPPGQVFTLDPGDNLAWALVVGLSLGSGLDAWTTTSAQVIFGGGSVIPEIPVDFFAPGSDPFDGAIGLVGAPIDASVASADTLVQRQITVPVNPSGPQTVPIEIAALNLVSMSPITVTSSSGPSTQWDVKVTLEPSPPSSGNASISVNPTLTGGAFSYQVTLTPHFTFTPLAGGPDLQLTGPGIALSTFNSTWSTTPPGAPYPGSGPNFYPDAPQSWSIFNAARSGFGFTQSFSPAATVDCNHNGVADVTDLTNGTSKDVNADGIPDECECLADWNHSGTVTVQDLFDFLRAWFAVHADYNHSGATTVQDLFDFLRAWFAHCA